ncbi:MAG: TonB-dependent receptor [Prolixibacteraceae bacterium]|nr:TonB-dependent receptor [Prolixibacteraceae bacterium]
MKLTFFILLLSIMHLSASVYSQQTKLNVSMQNATIREVLRTIEDQSDFYFLYTNEDIGVSRKVNVDLRDKSIEEVLDNLFRGTDVVYKIADRQVVLLKSTLNESNSQQQKTVSGKVTDSSGAPLPGVSVVVEGTTTGTITDFDGKYTLANVPGDAMLVFSFVGMRTKEILIAGKSSVNAQLEEETFGIDEVVAVGYGTVKKANLTGATASVNFSKLETRPAANTATLLQGQMSGVTVSNFETQPGDDNPDIKIRGVGTFNSGRNPLIIVDGVESSLTQIPSSDIESVSVLKDAASAAIYGVRAANGVILITTKRGAVRKPVFSVKQNFSLQQVLVVPDMVDSWDYAKIINMDRATKGQPDLYTEEMIQTMKDGSDPDRFANTNWQDEMYRIAPMNTTHLSVSGGSQEVKYMFSGEYFDQTGILLGTDTKRYSFRSNIDVQATKWIKLGLDVSGHYRRINETVDATDGGTSSVIYTMRRSSNPLVPVKYKNGHWGVVNGVYGETGSAYSNPVYLSQKGENFTDRYFFQGKVFADISLFKNFNYRVNLAGVYNASNKTKFTPTETLYYPDGTILSQNTQNKLENSNGTDRKYLIDNLFTYNLNASDHKFAFLLGQSAQYYRYDYMWASVKNSPSNDLHELGAGVDEKDVDGNANEVVLQSFFGRVNYNYRDKYMFEMNVRHDGSSRMPEENKYGLFPSFSGAWIISNENFLKTSNVLSFLKLRASWGQLGNQEIGNYAYSQSIGLGQNYVIGEELAAGAAITSLANSEIKWEKTTITDIGCDMNFFNNKLQLVADWFDKTSSDILVKLPIPITLGNLSAPYQNIAEVRNRGVEMDLKYNGNINRLNYFVGVNLSAIKNEIMDISGLTSWTSNSGRNINLEGHPIDSFYGLIAEGYFQNEEEITASPKQSWGTIKPGDVKYRDISGAEGVPDGKIDETYDKTIIGNEFPKLTYSFNFGGNYHGFDLYCFFQGISGIDRFFWYNNEIAGNYTKTVLDYWTSENPDAAFPRFGNETNNNKISTRWIKDASYLRLKNIELGYTFPKTLTNKIGVEKIRIYFSGNNLLTFSKIKDFDPEKISSDERSSIYPQCKVYSIGFNINL